MPDEITLILLGWFLGLASTLIIDLNRRQRSSKELLLVLSSELHELQYRMVLMKYYIDKKYSRLDRKTIEWAYSLLQKYEGINPSENITKLLSTLLEAEDTVLKQLEEMEQHDGETGITLKKFPTSILEANLSSLPYLKNTKRVLLSELRFRLNLLNELVDEYRFNSNATFQENNSENQRRLRGNIELCLQQYSNQCETIANLINKLENQR